MKKLQLLVALTIMSISGIQAMDHTKMKNKVAQLEQKLVNVYTNAVKDSGQSVDVTYSEDDKRFNISKCFFDIQRQQADINPDMNIILKNIEFDSENGTRRIIITVSNN